MGAGFVGRAQALAELVRLVDEACAGRGGVLLVAGEPGIGKTRLVGELAHRTAGTHVAWGSCWEGDGAPALWPWIQIVREVARRHTTVSRDPILGRLAPELGAAGTTSLDESTRFQLFDALSSFLKAAAEHQPLLVVLDDLHWADPSSLMLLGFLVAEVRTARIAVVGTYRDSEVPSGHVLHQLVSARSGVIPLKGLAPAEVSELVQAVTDEAPAPRVTEVIVRATGGNPFFVREMLRMPDLAVVPDSVGEAIRRRASRLSPAARELLDVASVIGHRFSFDMLGRVVTTQPLAEVVAARLLEEHEPNQVSFPHALVCEVVYRELVPDARTQLHRRVGDVLESQSAEPAELAHHFARSGQVDKALEYTERAGERALSVFAYEGAAAHFERALGLVPPAEQRRRAELYFALGRAHHAAGRAAESHAAFERVAQLSPPPELLARTALAFAVEFTAGVVDATEVRLLEQALAALPDADHPLRARVLARLGKALLWSPMSARRAALSEAAVAMARRIGDPATLAAVLYDRHVALWGPDVQDRLAIANEVVALAERCGEAELAVQGHALRIGNLFELGDLASVHVEIDAYDAATSRLRQPHYLWHVPLLRATLAALACRFDDAEELARGGLAQARRAQHQAADVFYGSVMAMIRLGQGRFSELGPAFRAASAVHPSLVPYRCALTVIAALSGQRDEAREELEQLTADRLARVPRDFAWVANLSLLSLATGALGDRAAAAQLYELLLPYRQTCARTTRIGTGMLGSVAHYLGLLAATLERWDDAVAHFELAIEMNLRIGAPAYVAASRVQLARAFRATGHVERAREELQRADVAAAKLGVALVMRDGGPADASAMFRKDGEVWAIRFRGDAFRIKDSVGIGYIARLLANPDRELHVVDLGGGDASTGSPVLDARAKSELKERLDDLTDQLRDAEACSDLERASRAREEIELLADQLASAVGLGNRDRRTSSDVERARMRVTKAIKSVVKRIAEHDPNLADHLDRSLKTGTYCVYGPDPGVRIAWHVTT